MVLVREDVEHRLADLLQVHPAAGEFERAADQSILLVEPLHELRQGGGGLTRAVENPFLHAHKILDGARIRAALQQAHIFLLHEPERHQ